MRKLILFFCLTFLFFNLGHTDAQEVPKEDQKVPALTQRQVEPSSQNDMSDVIKKSSEINFLKSKLQFLEDRFEEQKHCYDGILAAQRNNYVISVSVVIGILLAGIASISLLNFAYLRKDLKRDLDDAIMKVDQEFSKTVSILRRESASNLKELRKDYLDAAQYLRKEFSRNIGDQIGKISKEIEKWYFPKL